MKIIKRFYPWLLALFLGLTTTYSQTKTEQDTIKYKMEEVVVVANKENSEEKQKKETAGKTIYGNDIAKNLTSEPGVNNLAPFFAKFSGNNLDLLGFYINKVRIAGRTTQLQGAYFFANPNVYRTEIKKIIHSARYDDLWAVIDIIPEIDYGDKIKLSAYSDLLQRIVDLKAPFRMDELSLNGYMINSLRNLEALGVLEKAIPEIRALPNGGDFTHYSVSNLGNTKLEIIFRKAID